MRRKRLVPKTNLEKDWRRQHSIDRAHTLLARWENAMAPFPYTKEEILHLMYTPEQREAFAVLHRDFGPGLFKHDGVVSLRGKFSNLAGGESIYRVPFFFDTKVIAVDGNWLEAHALPEDVQQTISTWAEKRLHYKAARGRVINLITTLMIEAGTYAQMLKLWPGLVSFMQEDMKRTALSQKTTRISEELRMKWEREVANSIPLHRAEQILTEALMLEGLDITLQEMYAN